ncbi:DNA sulfur modification protein DndD [Mycobacterium gordonae]|nr:DNA sulfur modification protein DndD [Mycobacterium gordonae]OBK56466.1 DNA sulfur modification protein DndD [Mycobacterium gordonae]
MILDRLVLHNVGTFAGRHTLELTPPSATKPIILLGGLNGAGKTTVLEAIHLVLYGALAQVSNRRSGSYDNYLRGLIHQGVPHSEGAAVELTFHAHQEGTEREYWIRRSWRSSGASIREILLVSVDGRHDAALTSTWNEHVDTFLPRGIAHLFFFDGEQIEALADMERSREVLGSALAALLGLDLVEQLTTDLAVLRRRHRSHQVPAAVREAIEERQRKVTAIRQDEETQSHTVARLRVEVERAEKRLFDSTENYRSAGGELLDQRESAEATAARLRADLAAAQEELRQELGAHAPLLQVHDLLINMSARAREEAQANRDRIVVDIVADRDVQIIGQLKAAKATTAVLQAIEQYMIQDREERRASSAISEVVGSLDPGAVDFLCTTALPAAKHRLQTLLQRSRDIRADLEQVERVLVAMPDPDALTPLRSQRDDASAELIRLGAALTHAEERLALLRQERARADAAYEGALDDAAHANLAADDGRRLVEHVDRVRITLEALRVAATRRHLGRISELIHEALGQLLRKEKLITGVQIDPDTHVVELTGRDGRPLPSHHLSAGERQLLAVALLWGLARAAGQPLPVVIDTPLGRLDGSHREHLLERYFPYASHQVILLSTDTEIDDDAYARIAKHVGRCYRLVFDPARNATHIENGYFGE